MKTIIISIKKLAVFFLVLVFYTSASAQTKLQKAQQLKSNYDYAKAIVMYNDYFKTAATTIDDARSMVTCYMNIGNTQLAEEWLVKVISYSGHTPNDVLNYANVLKTNGKYLEAITQYENYSKMEPTLKDLELNKLNKIEDMIASCEKSIEWIAKPDSFDIENATMFNTEYSDFGLTEFGNGYIFSSDRKVPNKEYSDNDLFGWTGNPYLKLYLISGVKDNEPSTNAVEIPDLNNKYQNGASVYDAKNNIIYFTRTKMVKVGRHPLNVDPTSWYDYSSYKDYIDRWEIYSAHYENGQWKDIKAFEYNDPGKYSVGHPALSPDGSILYFASDMPGGFGGTDLYYCVKQKDGNWSVPKNCGNKINTAGKEAFPTIDKEGTLYFSSDGLPGMGGLDIFSSTGSMDNWSEPVNLKYPINSSKDDFFIYFTETGKSGYFSSNRDGGKGSDDIYYFSPTPPAPIPTTLVIAGIIKEKDENGLITALKDANVKVENKTTTSTVSLVSNFEGKFYTKAYCNDPYEITALKDGYFTKSQSVVSKCVTMHDTVFVELVLDKIVINKPIVMKNIYYDFDKWNIRPDAANELDKLVNILLMNPKIVIELGSHTDSRGSTEYNQVLSQKRAESAVAYIISKGINAGRISAKGYGKSVPVNKCVDGVSCTEEEYQLNRRTEFKVTSIKM